ncbi:MAG TPA: transcriptional regulator [Elusimicrobia bacterium]|nr:transcriptional regulator [Elusimicrobiota bacterium]
MPVISRFFGIVIFMFWREHRPPHFHAKYGDDEIVVDIRSGRVVGGDMSKRALALVQEWRKLRKAELLSEWELAEQKKALFPIKPLD